MERNRGELCGKKETKTVVGEKERRQKNLKEMLFFALKDKLFQTDQRYVQCLCKRNHRTPNGYDYTIVKPEWVKKGDELLGCIGVCRECGSVYYDATAARTPDIEEMCQLFCDAWNSTDGIRTLSCWWDMEEPMRQEVRRAMRIMVERAGI